MKKNIKLMSYIFCICVLLSAIFNKICAAPIAYSWTGATEGMEAWMNSLNGSTGEDKLGFQAIQKSMLIFAINGGRDSSKLKLEEYEVGKIPTDNNGGISASTPFLGLNEKDEKDVFNSAFMQAKKICHDYGGTIISDDIANNLNSTKTGTTDAEYAQTIYENCALEILEGTVDSLLNRYESDCKTNGDVTNGLLSNIPEEEITDTIILCNDESKKRFTDFKDVIEKYKNKNKGKIKELIDSGKVNENLKGFGEQLTSNMKDNLDKADEAGNNAQNNYNSVVEFKYDTPSVSSKPSLTLENLTNRVGALGTDGIEKLSDLVNFVGKDLIKIFQTIGTYLMYGAILFFGVRTIWSGATGKAQFKELLPYLLLGIVFFYLSEDVVNLATTIFDRHDYVNYASGLWGSVINIVKVLAFGGIIFTGIKFLFASSEGKADIKAALFPILIGCILVFASSTVVSIVLNTAKDVGLKSSNITEIQTQIINR